MTRRRALSVTVIGVVCLAVSLATWVMPRVADAGGVRLSIGIGIPAPVYVAPPPIIVHPAPYRPAAPGIVYPGWYIHRLWCTPPLTASMGIQCRRSS